MGDITTQYPKELNSNWMILHSTIYVRCQCSVPVREVVRPLCSDQHGGWGCSMSNFHVWDQSNLTLTIQYVPCTSIVEESRKCWHWELNDVVIECNP